MGNSKVICLCATFGRPRLLGEAIKCFIDQGYPNKELVVLNDQVGVELYMENCPDNVRIINYSTRFNSLGEKRNYLKSLGDGDYFAIWDDDDLYMPWRLSDSVSIMQKEPQFDIVKAKDALFSVDNKNYKIANNLFHSQALVSKRYMQSHQYPNKSVGEDMDFESIARVNSVGILPYYIYRYGLGIHHLSGIIDSKKSWEKSLTYSSYQILGKILVKPEFERDYWGEIGRELERINPRWGKEWEEKMRKYS